MDTQPVSRYTTRRAKAGNHPRILELLEALELDYPSRNLDDFRVYGGSERVVAIAELKAFPDFLLLSCVGVDERLQGSGIGKAFVEQLLQTVDRDVYLYTLVPGFFRKAGFQEAAEIPAGVPPRSYYGCHDCIRIGCTCMVKRQNASGIP